ncbi:MAG: hypothetical protein WC352_01030 [Candidatus Omnitrophota bacterium]|jgi:hypothetical protein
MEKNRWTEFLASKIRAQITLENAHKTVTLVLGIFCLVVLGFSLNLIGKFNNRVYLDTSKIMFLLLYHAVMVLGIYLPVLLQKGEKTLAGFFGIHDFSSLVLVASGMTFYCVVPLMLSSQLIEAAKLLSPSGFFGVLLWLNFFLSLFYVAMFAAFFAGYLFWPSLLTKAVEGVSKSVYALLGCHGVLFFLMGLGYTDQIKLGTPTFFEQFFVMALFWLFIVGSLHFIGRALADSALPALNALELDVVSGKIDQEPEMLERYRNAYTPVRFSSWLDRTFIRAASRAKEVAKYTQEGLALVNRDMPSEIDLRLVEERYKNAEKVYRKLEKDNQRFQATVSLIVMTRLQQEKIERVRDQFSRECRNAKIELASVRKRIDEKLVAIRNAAIAEAAVAVIESAPLLK